MATAVRLYGSQQTPQDDSARGSEAKRQVWQLG